MVAKYEPCSICEEYIEGVACTKDQCPVAKMKAEIERLTNENSKLAETNNALNYQIDTWNPSEAIKEFAERLKNKSDYCYFGNINSLVYRILEKDLNALVKEMTEGEDGNV